MLRRKTTTTKPSPIVFGLIAAVVVSVGFITTLAILAPEQLAEATTAATDLICDGCVGTTDIANSAVTSAKIGSGQVKNSDLGGSSVTTGKIADGQVTTLDIGPSAVTSPKIGDFQVGNGDLGTDAVTSTKIKNGEVKTEDLANDAVKPIVHKVEGPIVTIGPSDTETGDVDCPAGEVLTGGGFITPSEILNSSPLDENTWRVTATNRNPNVGSSLVGYAICIGPSP